MPFYEYECSSCKHYTEVLQKISDPVLTTCPECGRETLRKLVSAPVFRLKGNGWYETDFKSDSESKRNLAGADKEDTQATAKAETKTESKPKTESTEAKPAAAPAPVPAAPKAKAAAKRSSSRRPGAKPAAKGKVKSKPKAVAKSP